MTENEHNLITDKRADGLFAVRGPAERGLMAGVEMQGDVWALQDSLDELAQLASTAGATVVGQVTQRLSDPNPATLVGKGKVEELRSAARDLRADVILFDSELSPRQLRNLEEALNIKILDRTALILDIFARHAHTHEGRLQVELAQLEYRLPRLTRLWTHLSRQTGGTGGGGAVGLRGPGETQLEVDRRRARERIARLKDELQQVHAHRELYREQRRRAGIPIVALVGYTNAGKSTLLNALAQADVLAADVLFATLDPTTRQVALPDGRQVLLTDTVGFIQRLPTTLVEAFKATLEVIEEADLLLHVIDITHRNAAEQAQTVESVLEELGVGDKPRLVVLNKIDRLTARADAPLDGSAPADGVAPSPNGHAGPPDGDTADHLVADLGLRPDFVPVSAKQGMGLDRLKERIGAELDRGLAHLRVLLPYSAGDLAAQFHRQGTVLHEEFTPDGTLIEGRLPMRLRGQYDAYTQ
jgi:GTP-binding protein HflX